MSTYRIAHPIPRVRPLPRRWLDAWRAFWQDSRSELARACAARWDIGAAAAFDDRTLRDIGAPDEVRAEASIRRDADRLPRPDAMFAGRGW
jgi:hypothetical protein